MKEVEAACLLHRKLAFMQPEEALEDCGPPPACRQDTVGAVRIINKAAMQPRILIHHRSLS
jgi:hypothetical protein